MVIDESDGIDVGAGGFTEVSVVVVVVVVEVEVSAAGIVAEVSADAPVAAEPLHQSVLARALGEAFR